MKTTQLLTLTVLAGLTSLSTAATVLTAGTFDTPTGTDRGNWHYQSATLNDSDFSTTGDALGATVGLSSVSFIRYGGATNAGNIYLAVMTDATDISSVVASSSNSFNVSAAAQGDVMAWNFSSESISTSTEYFYAFYLDTNANNTVDLGDTATTARIFDQRTNVLGTLRNAPSGNIVNPNESAYLRIAVVPEPSSTALLGLGGLTLILRRRK